MKAQDDIQDLLKECEAKLTDLKSIKKMEAAMKRFPLAYEMRSNTILDAMSEHLQKLQELIDDLDKDGM